MAKLIGYLLSVIGLAGLVIYSFPEVAAYAKLPQSIASFTSTLAFSIVSVVLVILGLMFVIKGGSGRQAKEVPIYHGKNIVGYRRH